MALVIAFLVKTFVAQAFFIPSASMVPTLQIHDRVVVSRLAYDLHDPRRGDVVVFERDGDAKGDDSPFPVRVVRGFFRTVGFLPPSTEDFIKRVVGLPGETVQIRDGVVFIDGARVEESYLTARDAMDYGPKVVPEGHVFVMGDNRPNSYDSRYIGTIPQDRIVGRAIARVWPLDRLGFL